MDAFQLILAVAIVVCLPAFAVSMELDLAEDAIVWPTSGHFLANDRWAGPASLHDGTPETAYLPQPRKPFQVTVRVSTDPAQKVRLSLVSVVGEGGPCPIAGMEFGGVTIAGSGNHVRVEGALTTFDLRKIDASGTVLLLSFGAFPSGDGVVEIKVFASSPSAPEHPPVLDIRPWKHGVSIAASAGAGTHHVEVERTQPNASFAFALAPGLDRGFDAPRAGAVSYRARSVGFDGTVSRWSSPLELTHAERPPLPGTNGCVEGFYGRPWTWPERLKTIRLLGALGLGTYVYAPKDDLLHRERWSERYPDAEMEWFKRMLDTGRACGVDIVFAISPGLSMDVDSERDFRALTEKLRPFLDLGYTSFALLMDDISASRDAAGGRGHAKLANKLYGYLREYSGMLLSGASGPSGSPGAGRRGAPSVGLGTTSGLPSVNLMFVGTVYAGVPGTMQSGRLAYLKELSAIDPAIPIMWTGEGVFDAEIDPSHVRSVAEVIGRAPLLWDNYPVNDFFLGSRRLFMAPVSGRSAPALAEMSGILSNPMTHQATSRPALLSYGELLAGPGSYAGRYDDQDLALVLEASGDLSGLKLFAQDHYVNPKINPGAPPNVAIAAALNRFLASMAADTADETSGGGAAEQGASGHAATDQRVRLGAELAEALAERYAGDAGMISGARCASFADETWAAVSRRRAQIDLALAEIGVLCSADPWGAMRKEVVSALERYSPGPLDWMWFGLDEPLGLLLDQAEELAQSPVSRQARQRAEQIATSAVSDERSLGWPFAAGVPVLPGDLAVGHVTSVDLGLAPGATAEVVAAEKIEIVDGRLVWTPANPGPGHIVILVRSTAALVPLAWRPFVHELP